MSRAPVEFQLQNADGQNVEYRVIPHRGTELIELTWRVMHAAARPMGRILDSNLVLIIDQFQSEDEFRLDDIKDKIRPEFADAFNDVFSVIFASGSVELTRGMLKHTYRNGKPLSKDFEFDEAFQANPGEMVQVFFKALQVNNFLELFSTLLGNFVSVSLDSKVEDNPKTQSVDLLAGQG